jgi:predicted RND superfamily exporter protein
VGTTHERSIVPSFNAVATTFVGFAMVAIVVDVLEGIGAFVVVDVGVLAEMSTGVTVSRLI